MSASVDPDEREVQPKKNRMGWESLERSFFVLIGTFNG
jgi:hypothetical protein